MVREVEQLKLEVPVGTFVCRVNLPLPVSLFLITYNSRILEGETSIFSSHLKRHIF